MQTFLITIYLAAIVAANWSISTFGPGVAALNGFLFIGLVITTRDRLHDLWQYNLKRNMFLLIAAGSLLSIFFNAGLIALCSFLAFAVSETVDAIIYQMVRRQPILVRINASNAVSAVVDSVLFLSLAAWLVFGWPPGLWLIAGQIAAKVGGGFAWSILLAGVRVRAAEGSDLGRL